MLTTSTLSFTANPLDRAGHLRANASDLLRHPDARLLAVWRGKPLVDANNALVWLTADDPLFDQSAESAVFLGLRQKSPRFAADVSAWQAPEGDEPAGFFDPNRTHHPMQPDGTDFADLRAMIATMNADDSAVAATAKGVLAWHDSHQFCARCGARSAIDPGGWQRKCKTCGTGHFPRTDPVVIMLVTHGNLTLLGRGAAWPAGMYSCLAGFMEPGETIEAAVRRETNEETGIRIGAVDYMTCQPWPFPTSLMIGCHGSAESLEIILDPNELEDARWISRENLMHALAGLDPVIKPARKGSIARFLMESWVSDRWQ